LLKDRLQMLSAGRRDWTLLKDRLQMLSAGRRDWLIRVAAR